MISSRIAGPITLAVIGAGQRGRVRIPLKLPHSVKPTSAQGYAEYALKYPEDCQIVAVAEPRCETQQLFANEHGIDDTLVFQTWRDLHAASAETIGTVGKRLADAVIVAVQDQMHMEVVTAFAEVRTLSLHWPIPL